MINNLNISGSRRFRTTVLIRKTTHLKLFDIFRSLPVHMHGGCLLDFALAGSTKVNFGAVEVAKIHVLANCADGSDVVLKVNIDRNLDGGAFASLLEKVERYPHFRGAHVLALAAAELDSTEKETSAQVKNADQIASSSADAPASVQVVVRAASEEQVPVNMGAFGRMRKPAPA